MVSTDVPKRTRRHRPDNRGIKKIWDRIRRRITSKLVAWRTMLEPTSEAGRNIDVSLTWTPVDEPITLGGAEGKSYGGVTLRFAPRVGTIITVSDGRAKADLLIAKLPWADLSAEFSGGPTTSGAALFVDPRNPDYPPEWMRCAGGGLAGGKPRTLQSGESLTCRYRLWIHRGTPDAAAVQMAYDAYGLRASTK